ncbi:amidohydrolase family protein [Parasedimentitalea denitrificans]|uniref:amidohydrolase family protein n=1 Tax=Parasedimentitalea denitrificans TaxID=2211118 RepID=UPI0034E2E0E6
MPNLIQAITSTTAVVGLMVAPALADTLYFNGEILTMDGPEPSYVEAVVEKDGRIAFVGSKSEALIAYPDAVPRDLEGQTMLPGFLDPHGHFMFALNMVNQVNVAIPPVGTVTKIADLVENLKAFQQERDIQPGEWIVGWGYDQDGLAEGRHIIKSDLDAAFPDNKIMLIHVSGHGAVLNSAALDWAGIDASTETPAGGIIARVDGSNEPAGLLMETAYIPVLEKLPQPTESEMLELMEEAQMMYASEGYTHAQEGFTYLKDLAFLQKAADEGRIFLDIVSLPAFVEAREFVGNPNYVFGEYNGGLKLQGIKFTQDGSPQGKTAHVSHPYLTGGPNGEEGWTGETTQPREDFEAQVKMAIEAGLQVFVHANGDATIDQVIEAVRGAGVTAADDRRTIVVHSQFQRPDQLDAYVELGLSPSYFTNHTFFWGDVHVRNIGQEAAEFISPVMSSKAKGLTYSNHTDFNVTPLDPMFVMWSARARQTRSGVILGADERADAYTALQGLTTGPAWQIFEEGEKGMIRTGLKADFVVLSQNPMTTDIDSLRETEVIETIKEGRVIYSSNPKLANPSATFCIESGGAYDIRDGEGGKVGYCTLADGSEVDAWEYYRKNAG